MKKKLISSPTGYKVLRRFIALGAAFLLGLLLTLSLLIGMTLAQEPQSDQPDITGASYWLILDTARPVEETLPPLLETLEVFKTSGTIVEFDSTPQRSDPMAAAGVRVVVARPERLDLLRTLPGVLDAVSVLPPPPPQPGNLGILVTNGVITGLVIDTVSGSPLSGIPVYAYDAASFAYITNINTNAGGEYTIAGTAAYSQVRVIFNKNGNNVYTSEWYNDKPFFSVATPIDLPDGNTVSNINAALERTGTISGVVADQKGAPAQDVKIVIYKSEGFSIGESTTGVNGLFISRVPSGTYKLKLYGEEYLSEWYQGKNSFGNAAPIVTTANATTSLTAQITRAGVITGVVTGGLDDVIVTVYDTAGKVVRRSLSDPDGKYRVPGLLSGNYRLGFMDRQLSYETKYYNNKPTLAEADLITITLGETTGGINANLAPATGRITGTITKNGGVPLAAGESVIVFLHDTVDDASMISLPYLNFVGNGVKTTYVYTVSGGTYKVEFNPGFNAATQWYNNQTGQDNANLVTVIAGETTPNINTDLTTTISKGCIAGVVTTSEGAPLKEAIVGVYKIDNNLGPYIPHSKTKSDGTYLICGLEPGDYQVSFSYFPAATTWHNGKTSHTAATTVTVTFGVTTTDVNGSLLDRLGGCIIGKITNPEGQALSRARFQIFDVGGNVIPFYKGFYGVSLGDDGNIDGDGGFVACGLESGDYTITIYNNSEQDSIAANVIAGQQTDVGTVKIGAIHIYLPIINKN